MLPPLKLTST
jgi:hypothetical protein